MIQADPGFPVNTYIGRTYEEELSREVARCHHRILTLTAKVKRTANPFKRHRYWNRIRASEARLLALKLANS